MKIYFENKNEIDNIDIHDSIFKSLFYDYDNRQIAFSCDNIHLKKRINFLFNNILLYSMQSCSFWHGGNRILSVYYDESTSLMYELIKIQNKDSKMCDSPYLNNGISYLKIKFEINSGDTLFIVCENVDCTEEILD